MRLSTSTRFSTIFRSMLLLAVLIVPQAAHAGFQWHATVGAQSHDKSHQVLAFLPNEIWIHAGDSVMWTFNADDIHTVTFLLAAQPRPSFMAGCTNFPSSAATINGSTCVTTAPLVRGATFTANFPKVGNYKLVCLVHENMTAVVHVLDVASALPHDQGFYDDQANDEQKELLSDNQRDNDHKDHDHGVTVGIGEVVATAGGTETLSVVRFIHDKMVIHAGETVEFTNEDPITPHTITFGPDPSGDPGPPSATVTTDADGARHVVINSPADTAHSGIIMAAPQERMGLVPSAIGVTRFRVTFPHAGTYKYQCALHDDLGMVGQITVLP